MKFTNASKLISFLLLLLTWVKATYTTDRPVTASSAENSVYGDVTKLVNNDFAGSEFVTKSEALPWMNI
jgi:hypothetical protein